MVALQGDLDPGQPLQEQLGGTGWIVGLVKGMEVLCI